MSTTVLGAWETDLAGHLSHPSGFAALTEVPGWLDSLTIEAIRDDALEGNAEFRQYATYCVLLNRGRAYVYARAGGADARLVGKGSIGIGGHVEGTDAITFSGAVKVESTVVAAARRELFEEVGLVPAELVFRGLIHLRVDHVSQCHLGFVFTADVPDEWMPNMESGLTHIGWCDLDTLARLRLDQFFESWSSELIGNSLPGWLNESNPRAWPRTKSFNALHGR